MTLMLWSKMPSKWIAEGILRESFSGGRSVSDDIAALKLFIVLCLLAKQVNRSSGSSVDDVLEIRATYDQLTDMCSLSRSLVSRGLKKLRITGLLSSAGVRTKTYTFTQGVYRGWCKLPKRALVRNEEEIPAMKAFLNRYSHERDALKCFLYILASRSNSRTYVDLSRGTIAQKTGVSLDAIDGAIGFLQSTSLISKVEDKGFLANSIRRDLSERLHRYWVIGSSSLNYKTYSVESEDSILVRGPSLYFMENNRR
ncbi:hypothetical protein NMR92_003500 [Vibrio cholerae]|nr:hypothetical protein [Vibrio cholerae]EJL6492537.1 hypothetical protein [Vibrio cholerae]EJL6644615.1 hypothetical protein [Vibrio cholerae]EKF6710815.1 hypothetical protein [Vibrio cholerae]EMA3774930.1 hypothetical protein [Vibrio cholerae]